METVKSSVTTALSNALLYAIVYCLLWLSQPPITLPFIGFVKMLLGKPTTVEIDLKDVPVVINKEE